MQYKKGKLFIDTNRCISVQVLDESQEYYDYIKVKREEGFNQFIITSNLMIDLVVYFVKVEHLHVYHIECMEEDEDLKTRLHQLLSALEKDRAILLDLVDELRFLTEESSIEIKRIYAKGRNQEGEPIDIFVQSNGIIGINEAVYDVMGHNIVDVITKAW